MKQNGELKINPHICCQIFDKGPKNSDGKDNLFSMHGIEKPGYQYLTPYTKINTKWIEELIIRPGTIKLPGENVKKLSDIVLDKGVLDMTPKTKPMKVCINSKSFCMSKKSV